MAEIRDFEYIFRFSIRFNYSIINSTLQYYLVWFQLALSFVSLAGFHQTYFHLNLLDVNNTETSYD